MYNIVVIIGPTGAGKTNLALAVAAALQADILSADARQVYQYMDIGTNKILAHEQKGIPHYGLDLVTPERQFSVVDYERYALEVIQTAQTKGKNLVIVGGTGLYIRVLEQGIDELPNVPEAVRAGLQTRLANEGLRALSAELQTIDPTIAQTIALDNPRRVTRALEVYYTTGKPMSYFLDTTKKVKRNFRLIKFCLSPEREQLYQAINQRTKQMFANGLLTETEHLARLGYEAKLQETIGYKEAFAYLQNLMPLTQAIDLTAQHTRNYAKRQLTWFRKEPNTHWLSTPNPQIVLDTFFNSR